MKKILLVDGSNILHRAYHGLPLLRTSQGRYTNAAYGFMIMLQKILDQENPTHVAICFDKGKNTFRHKRYPQYKAQRKPLDPELVEQFPLIREVLSLNGYCTLESDLYEADDIIGTLAKMGSLEGDEVLIFSGDKDLLQMLDSHIRVISGKKTLTDLIITDVSSFEEKYGIEPKCLVDLKGLMGDASDNLPGVTGVGEKTALKLLHQYGTLESVYRHIDELPKNKLREKLERDKEAAFLSYELATIDSDMPLDIAIDDLIPQQKDWHGLYELYKELEFRSLMSGIEKGLNENKMVDSAEYNLFGDAEDLAGDKEYGWEEVFSLDEFCQGDEIKERLFARAVGDRLIFANESNKVLVRSLSIESERQEAVKLFTQVHSIISHDLKNMIHLCHSYKIPLPSKGDDIEVMAYLLEATVDDYTLSELIHHYLNKDIFLADTDNREKNEAALSISLYECLLSELEEKGLLSLYQDVEAPLIQVLADMEICGIKVNRDNLREMSIELEKDLEEITAAIYEYAGHEFNINSPKQLGEVLFNELGMRHIKKTKTGYSTNNEVLEELKSDHPIVEKILLYRYLAKIKSTYTDALEKLISPDDNCIHTVFRQTVTATGRLSSTDPNLQNIPVRLGEGRKVRKAFTARDDEHILLSADYSQIELRILAHYAGDEGLINSFLSGEDIHARTAGEIFSVPLSQVDASMRRRAKAVNFGIIYGISDYGLGRDLGISRKEAKEYIDRYFSRYPGVEKYLNDIVKSAERDGYVTTLMGRRRYLPNIKHKNFNLRSFAQRTAMNTPIQGTAADIIKKAMVDLYASFQSSNFKSKMVLQVHDELIFDCLKDELDQIARLVKRIMEHTVELKVPLTVDMKTGEDWYSLEKYEVMD